MQAVKRGLIAAASVGALLAVVGVAPAVAGPVTPVNFTWNPSGVNTNFTQPNTSQEFTAAGFQVADYALIDLGTPNGSGGFNNVSESAILAVNSLSLVSGTGAGFINGVGGGNGTTDYELYFVVTAHSNLAPCAGGGTCGQFTSLSYTLVDDVGGRATFTNVNPTGPAVNANGDTLVNVASGNLFPGTSNNTVSISSTNVPSASVDVNVTTDNTSFWLSPAISSILALETSFINNSGEVTTGVDGSGNTDILLGATSPIKHAAGGGSVDMVAVPEPLTLSLFGAGLAGAVGLRRRKAKKA